MEIFFDTTVLVAASVQGHPHYSRARPALEQVARGRDSGFIGVHSLAETYAALTRLPLQPRIHPSQARRILADNIIPHFQIISIGKKEYVEAIDAVANGGWIGGKIYDALLLHCAAKRPLNRIYTFNLADFKQLAPESLRGIICAP